LQNPCNLRSPQSQVAQTGISTHSTRLQDCADTEGTTVNKIKKHSTKNLTFGNCYEEPDQNLIPKHGHGTKVSLLAINIKPVDSVLVT
jgi:hypothetical protein